MTKELIEEANTPSMKLTKAEIEGLQQSALQARKNELADALKKVKYLYKELDFTAGMLKSSLCIGGKSKNNISDMCKVSISRTSIYLE